MPILNLNEATKLYYGNTEAQKLYKGSELLYPNFILALTPALWLDANDSSTITLVSGAVSEWRDKSGNNRDASQGTSSNRPTITSFNGKNSITFNGTSHFLKINSLFFLGNVLSTFYVLKTNNVTVRQNIFTNGNNNQEGQFWNELHNINSFCAAVQGSFTAMPVTNSISLNRELRGYCKNGTAQHFLYLNGISETVATTGAAYDTNLDYSNTSSPSLIGARLESLITQPLNGQIAEILLFPSFLSAGDRQKVEGYLAWKWGLVASLPSNHPYKNQEVVLV